MRSRNIFITAVAVTLTLLTGTGAQAVGTSLTCYNTKTGAKKIVTTAKCPTGFSLKAPAPKKSAMKIEEGVTVSNAYVKALDTSMAMNGVFMTAAFMYITNISDRDVTLTGGTADWAPMVQVHEVVNGVMRQRQGGLVIKAGRTEVLQAGGNHVMFMNLPKKVLAGDEVTFALTFADGGQVKVTAPVKMSNSGSETYKPASGTSGTM